MCVIFSHRFACWIDGGSFRTCGERDWCEWALWLCGWSNFHRILVVELFPFTWDLPGWRTHEKTSYTFFLQRALRLGKNGLVWDLPHWLHTDIDHIVILAWNVSDRWIPFKRCKIFIWHYFEVLWFCCNLVVLLHFRCISNYLNSRIFIVFPLNIFHCSSTRCNVFVLGDEWNISHEV